MLFLASYGFIKFSGLRTVLQCCTLLMGKGLIKCMDFGQKLLTHMMTVRPVLVLPRTILDWERLDKTHGLRTSQLETNDSYDNCPNCPGSA